ncbi:MAG: helix-turn-helix transcriptional regulator [Planctomycetes bacterium]|nr:helix-turn-helix transcriptional regulator [Planctomycetota bacterium]
MKPRDRCPCEGQTLDRLIQPAVLATLARESLHGYALIRKLRALPTLEGRAPDSSGVYRVLNAMEEQGLIRSEWETGRSGPAKRRYGITPAGRDCLRTWAGSLRAYAGAVATLADLAEKAVKRSKR